MTPKITILGAGLTGLTLAYFLNKQGISCEVIEARKRLGGRIFTKMSGNHIPVDLGAAWFWDYNPKLKDLLKELHLESYPQTMGDRAWYQPAGSASFRTVDLPPSNQMSYRIKGGTTNLILTLAAHLDPKSIKLNTQISKILRRYSKYTIETSKGIIAADIIVNTIPPALTSQIEFDPILPAEYLHLASQTHTWMQDSIKFGLGFKSAFWKGKDIPLTAFSQFAVVSEMYDYSNQQNDRFAVMGFLNAQVASLDSEDRKEKVLSVLETLLGAAVRSHVSYEECLWNEEPFTKALLSTQLAPHQNNGAALLRSTFHEGTLIMSGSESSSVLPGYMEGAVNAAMETFGLLMQKV